MTQTSLPDNPWTACQQSQQGLKTRGNDHNAQGLHQNVAAASLIATQNLSFGEAEDASPLKNQIKGAADALRFPGFVAGVVRDGRLVDVQAEGFADIDGKLPMQRDNIFNVASLTKTFTAVMMMQFQREKRLNIDDYLLDYPFLSVGFSSDRLLDANTRLKHVLSHTSEGTPGDNFVYSGSR